jgi:hypothetical protein
MTLFVKMIDRGSGQVREREAYAGFFNALIAGLEWDDSSSDHQFTIARLDPGTNHGLKLLLSSGDDHAVKFRDARARRAALSPGTEEERAADAVVAMTMMNIRDALWIGPSP